MEIKILDDKKNKMIFEIKGADHTLCNALKKEIAEDKHVKISSYSIRHPQISLPQMIVETDGEITPKSAVMSAVGRVQKDNEKFRKEFLKEIR